MIAIYINAEKDERLDALEHEFDALFIEVRAHIDYTADALYDEYTKIVGIAATLKDSPEQPEELEFVWTRLVQSMRVLRSVIQQILKAEYDKHEATQKPAFPNRGQAMRQVRIEQAVRRNVHFGRRHA